MVMIGKQVLKHQFQATFTIHERVYNDALSIYLGNTFISFYCGNRYCGVDIMRGPGNLTLSEMALLGLLATFLVFAVVLL